MDVSQLIVQLIVGVGMGGIISVMSYLSQPLQDWDNRKFIFSIGVAVFSALAIIQSIEGGITEDNIIYVILTIAGSSFLTNKTIQIAARLKETRTAKSRR